jgi:hypothetical protein
LAGQTPEIRIEGGRYSEASEKMTNTVTLPIRCNGERANGRGSA